MARTPYSQDPRTVPHTWVGILVAATLFVGVAVVVDSWTLAIIAMVVLVVAAGAASAGARSRR